MSDLIDRQALLKQIDIDSDGEPGYYGDTWKFIDTIKNMPNVHDLPKDTDTISRQAAIDALAKNMPSWTTPDGSGQFDHDIQVTDEAYVDCMQIIHDMQSAQPEPKRGKWIEAESQCGIKCSKCGYPVDDFCHSIDYIDLDYAPNYCPHCGADMREVTT